MLKRCLIYKDYKGEGTLVHHPSQKNKSRKKDDAAQPNKYKRREMLSARLAANRGLRKIAGKVYAGLAYFAVAFSWQAECVSSVRAPVLPPIIKLEH